MEIRAAEPADLDRIREIAAASFQSSFSLSPEEIESILEDAFSEERLSERLSDPNARVLVAEHETDAAPPIGGFADAEIEPQPTLRWLHVDPVARGAGIATALVDRVHEEAGGTPLTARVLEEAVEGGEFLERFGLRKTGSDHVEYTGVEFAVSVFTAAEDTDRTATEEPAEPSVAVPESVTADGRERPVDRENPIPGRDAPFFRTTVDADRDEPYGYFCSNCGSTDVAADGLDRLECGNCGNAHLADEWDGAYL